MTPAPIEDVISNTILSKITARIRNNYDQFSGEFPSYGNGTTTYNLTPNKNWLASFWTGLLWLTYSQTKAESDADNAKKLLPTFEQRLDKGIRLNHDLGFIFTLSARAQWQLTNDETAHALALRGAKVLITRFRKAGQYIQAWDDVGDADEGGRFIIDCMMNLPLLLWASHETGDARFHDVAIAHAKTSQTYLIRDNGESYHTYYLDQDTGKPIGPKTHQGYADDSFWSRGQGWAIHGFAMLAEWTGDSTFIDTAKLTADRYLEYAPLTEIVPWDLRLPADATPYPDSSADAIVAGGLLRLADLTGNNHYREKAIQLIRTLCDKAFDTRPDAQGLLKHGTQHAPHNYGVDTYTIFGDYFFYEAILRLLNKAPDFWGPYKK